MHRAVRERRSLLHRRPGFETRFVFSSKCSPVNSHFFNFTVEQRPFPAPSRDRSLLQNRTGKNNFLWSRTLLCSGGKGLLQKAGRRWLEATHLAQVKPRPDSLHYFHLRQHVHFSIIIRAFARKTFVSPRALHRPPCHQQQKRPHSPQARQKNAKTGRRLHLAPRPAMRQSRPTSSPPRSRLRHWSKVPAPQEAQDR